MNKFEELMNAVRLGELMSKKEQEKEKKCNFACIVGVIALITAMIAIAYALYKHFNPDYLEDFDDDDFLDEEEEEEFTDDDVVGFDDDYHFEDTADIEE